MRGSLAQLATLGCEDLTRARAACQALMLPMQHAPGREDYLRDLGDAVAQVRKENGKTEGRCDVLGLSSSSAFRVAARSATAPAGAPVAFFIHRSSPMFPVNAVAGDVRAIDDDVAEVDANAELEALVSRLRLVRHRHGPLHVDRAPQRRVCAAEFEEHPIARG